jgi:acyl-CoA thioesterase FadM
MNLWGRLVWLWLSSFWRERLAMPFAVSSLAFRVWPHDLDVSIHMNNGRYLTIMDLGRFDLLLRSGLAGPALRAGWTPILSACKIRFRRELRPFRAYRLETRIVWWSQAQIVMEQRFISPGRDGLPIVHAAALVLAGLYDRSNRQFVPMDRLFALVGLPPAASPEPSPEIEAFLAANDALKRAGRDPVPTLP